jgi:predicted signal transduction protein with EAL and GGDEF domain
MEQFPDISKMCKVAPCWIYIGIEIFTLACDICSPNVVQLVARRDVDVMPLDLYEDRENRHRKGRNLH